MKPGFISRTIFIQWRLDNSKVFTSKCWCSIRDFKFVGNRNWPLLYEKALTISSLRPRNVSLFRKINSMLYTPDLVLFQQMKLNNKLPFTEAIDDLNYKLRRSFLNLTQRKKCKPDYLIIRCWILHNLITHLV